MKNKIAAAILLTVTLAVTGCGSGGSDATENTTASQEGINSDLKSANESSQEVFAMDTYMTCLLYTSGVCVVETAYQVYKGRFRASGSSYDADGLTGFYV